MERWKRWKLEHKNLKQQEEKQRSVEKQNLLNIAQQSLGNKIACDICCKSQDV